MTRTVTQLRKSLCLDLAELLEQHFGLADHHRWDVDRAARLISCRLPLTYPEAEAEMDALRENIPAARNRTASVLDELRDALGLGREISLVELIRAAAQRVKSQQVTDPR